MRASTLALLGAGALALGAAAPSRAAEPTAPHAVQPVVIFVPMPMGLFAPPPLALDRIVAAQEAALTQLIAQMSQMPAFPALPWMAAPGMSAAPGMQVVTVSMSSSGRGFCQESMTQTFGPDGRPHVVVKRAGDACGPLPTGFATTPGPQAAPMPEVSPSGPLPRVIHVNDVRPVTPTRAHAYKG
ncbi:MAG: hypothetical protein J0I21_12860 [Alphaproteobacteria bacterium]|nr:hypothetical protein [Alphaproteobacteria bacterium]